MHWLFGKNSLWQTTGLNKAVGAGVTSGTAGLGGSITGFFSSLSGALRGETTVKADVDHGVTDTVKYGVIALVAYMVLK